jgi:hypothetical protein
LSARIKYHETGVSFYKPDTRSGSIYDLGNAESFVEFYGAVISIPLNLKYEFRIHRNLRGSLKLGYAYNIETKSDYANYSPNMKADYKKQYGSNNAGFGLNYFINNSLAVYADTELFLGTSKGHSDGFYKTLHNTKNNLVNIGVKYNFGANNEAK